MNEYNIKNRHERDSRLTFRAEDHTYHIAGRMLRPVTSVVEECFEKFDAEHWAQKIAAKRGMKPCDILSEWAAKGEEARSRGTEMHAKIESYYLGEECETDDTFRLFEKFAAENTLHPYRTEWAVYDEEMGVAGTIDFLELHEGVFTIYDWKRSDKLVENGVAIKENKFHKCGKRPFHFISDTPYWHYAIQLSIYRLILERQYGIKVCSGHLVVLHPNNDTYHVLEVPYLRKELLLLFNINE